MMAAANSKTPRSMPVGLRNQIRPNDSASLWNYSLSPGWSQEESEILRKALIRFGVGQWTKIIESGCLPGKTIAQLNLQTQRMCGQQSTAEFSGLHMDITEVGRINSLRIDVLRKGGLIINAGAKPTFKEVKQKLEDNRQKFELPEPEWKYVELPRPAQVFTSDINSIYVSVNAPTRLEQPLAVLERKKEELARLQNDLMVLQAKIREKKNNLIRTSSTVHGMKIELVPASLGSNPRNVEFEYPNSISDDSVEHVPPDNSTTQAIVDISDDEIDIIG